MVDDLQDLRIQHVVHCLHHFIMVYQDQSSFMYTQQITSGYHAHVFSCTVQNGEVTIALFRHGFTDRFCIICQTECHQVFFSHKEIHRHTLVDQPCHRICVQRGHNDGTVPLLCQTLNGAGYGSTKAHHNTSCLHLNGTKLGLISVSKDDHVMFFNIIFHHIRICSRNDYFSFIKKSVFISNDHLGIQCFQNIFIRSFCHR